MHVPRPIHHALKAQLPEDTSPVLANVEQGEVIGLGPQPQFHPQEALSLDSVATWKLPFTSGLGAKFGICTKFVHCCPLAESPEPRLFFLVEQKYFLPQKTAGTLSETSPANCPFLPG